VAHNVRFINPTTISKPPGYTHVVEITGPGRIAHIAGQLGLDTSGKLVGTPGDFSAQAAQAFENLKAALCAVGAGAENIATRTASATRRHPDIAYELTTRSPS